MSVNKQTPCIQMFVAVRVGNKHDPIEAPGTACFLQHLMFQGTSTFGTKDYPAEKALLDEIEALSEQYVMETNALQRSILYCKIDSLSQLASHYAMPHDYDKLMQVIDAENIYSFTDFDKTVFGENIPAKQLENWVRIQYERFSNPVFRMFYSEMEAVCEDYNLKNNDLSQTTDTLMELFFPKQPFKSNLATENNAHLQNLSVSKAKEFFKKYYTPDNMAIVMSGDFDADKAISVINKYFGKLKRNEDAVCESITVKRQSNLVEKEIVGPDTPVIAVGWLLPPINAANHAEISILESLICNQKNGLADVDFNQEHPILNFEVRNISCFDYGVFILTATIRENSQLAEARCLILKSIEYLKQGFFSDSLFQVAVNHCCLEEDKILEHNEDRAFVMLNSFIHDVDWKFCVEQRKRISTITKQELVNFLNKYLTDENAIVYKIQDTGFVIEKMILPPLFPLQTDNDYESDLMLDIKQNVQLQQMKR
jgi:predicted Zn-dependent peptidase